MRMVTDAIDRDGGHNGQAWIDVDCTDREMDI